MQRFAFGPRNYRLMGIGLVLLAIGFVTMMFGDKNNYGEDFVGITLGPLLLIAGFLVEFAAILVRDNSAVVSRSDAAPAPTAFTLNPTGAPAPAAPVAPVAKPTYKRL
ncbi:DUF3098 domain-containing protein [Hymenobacter caeli]|uniref:DUF3098 domain-containing protein n=1 Tax=Hymenobacter caeli TaxID=2735894 RepID=A0ABX2FPM0_9BACT|nr:DUF3098 domain-containing protein [Hymenobacter caeli]NRT19126.1 hypothetical protein [Hymenobacter caeli]